MFYSEELLMSAASFDPVTFTENGMWVVPHGIKRIAVDCVAASGNPSIGGNGGRVQCILNVTAGNILYIVVGVQRTSATSAEFNSSDIRMTSADLYSRLVVAGGGGSAYRAGANGGAGGGLVGGTGLLDTSSTNFAGTGGTQSSGGTGYAASGTFGYGGVDDSRGGDGWYGGGAGHNYVKLGTVTRSGGAGGGSSYTHPTLCSEVVHTQGYRAGSGYVTISTV